VSGRAASGQARNSADTIQDIIASRDVTTDRPAAEAGLESLRRGGDFADGVIRHEAIRARCRAIATFGRAFAERMGDLGLVPE
jgi:predicted nucleic-acid-binding protein